MGNLDLYNQVRKVPEEAQKTIKGGRLKGFTEINPMWRIKKLTELFGACGIGWYTEIVRYWIEEAVDNQRTANILIKLFIKTENGWSMPIEGIGGTSFVSNETKGLYINEDCYKMAYTDALSVACKSLGIGADVYFEKDCTKYTHCDQQQVVSTQVAQQVKRKIINDALLDNRERCEKMIAFLEKGYKQNPESFAVIRYLQDLGYEFEDCADRRLTDIWMQNIMNKGL